MENIFIDKHASSAIFPKDQIYSLMALREYLCHLVLRAKTVAANTTLPIVSIIHHELHNQFRVHCDEINTKIQTMELVL